MNEIIKSSPTSPVSIYYVDKLLGPNIFKRGADEFSGATFWRDLCVSKPNDKSIPAPGSNQHHLDLPG